MIIVATLFLLILAGMFGGIAKNCFDTKEERALNIFLGIVFVFLALLCFFGAEKVLVELMVNSHVKP